jgi:hypothetical protein
MKYLLLLTLLLTSCQTVMVKSSWEAPIDRVNGDPLYQWEIAGYQINIYDTATEVLEVVEVDGGKTEVILMMNPGLYTITIIAVDINGLTSDPSDPELVMVELDE